MRFSLRTLLLLVLTLASAATLWWNWGPWIRAFEIKTKSPIQACEFVANDSRICVLFPSNCDLEVYDASNGKLLHAYHEVPHTPKSTPSFRVSSTGRYLYWDYEYGYHSSVSKLWLLDTGAPLYLAAFTISVRRPVFSSHDQFVIFETLNGRVVATLPDLKCIREFGRNTMVMLGTPSEIGPHQICGNDLHFSPDEKWLIHCDRSLANFYSLNTGKLTHFWHMPQDCTMKCAFSPEGDKIAFEQQGAKFNETRVVLREFPTANLVAEFDGSLDQSAFQSGGKYFVLDQTFASIWQLSPHLKELISRGDRVTRPGIYGDRLFCMQGETENVDPLTDLHPIVQDLSDGTRPWTLTNDIRFLDNQDYATRPYGVGGDIIVSAKTGENLFRVPNATHPSFGSPDTLAFAKQSSTFMTYGHATGRVSVWHLSRPHSWYGPAFLPEFWLTTLLTLALFWSLLRDRKTLKPLKPESLKP